VTEIDPAFFAPTEVTGSAGNAAVNDHDARLIWDLVSQIRPAKDVLESYGVTPAQFASKANNPIWASAFREAQRVWKSDMNIQTRVRLKAAFLLEDSLLPLFRVIQNADMPVNARLAAIKQMTEISTVANVPKESATSEKHNITINIGGDRPPIKVISEQADGSTSTFVAG
jgi:hypothetical protein